MYLIYNANKIPISYALEYAIPGIVSVASENVDEPIPKLKYHDSVCVSFVLENKIEKKIKTM